MTISSTTASDLVETTGRALRILLATVAIVVLVSVAFVVGRVTVSSSPAPVTAPAASTIAPVPNGNGPCEHFNHYMSAGC